MKDKALFIINPISGTGKQNKITSHIDKDLDKNLFEFSTQYTEYRGHATQISQQASKHFDYVIAVGGDGTVNEVAKGLIGSQVKMGIIPVGSGNGLARHLHLPMNPQEAIRILNFKQYKTIDTATINGEYFVNVAGIGFDAHVAHLYAKTAKRGPIPYIKMATYEFQQYKAQTYTVIIENQTYIKKAFLVSFANSAQFGNNAYISPHSLIDDGLLDVCMLDDFPKVEAGQLAVKLFNKRLDKSKYMHIVRGTHVRIIADQNIKGHIDGEPVNFLNELDIKVIPASLNVVYNKNVKINLMEQISRIPQRVNQQIKLSGLMPR